MHIAIDLDGVIGKRPILFLDLAKAFVGHGHQITVLTAAAGEMPPSERPAEVARRLRAKGFTVEHQLACVESHEKAEWCKTNRVHLLFDDDPKVIASVSEKSLVTVCMLVK